MREKKKPKRDKTRFWCPGGLTTIFGRKNRGQVRCSVCTRKFLASENTCCGSDERGSTWNRDHRTKGGMRKAESCAPGSWRVPKHKAYA